MALGNNDRLQRPYRLVQLVINHDVIIRSIVRQLLASEVRKHERVAYGVKVTTVIMGNKDGQVPLDKLTDHIRKQPKALQAHQITDIKQRLRALDALRPPVPVPKGPMPTSPRQVKGVRQAMRGR